MIHGPHSPIFVTAVTAELSAISFAAASKRSPAEALL
jgi:hypothetical protein